MQLTVVDLNRGEVPVVGSFDLVELACGGVVFRLSERQGRLYINTDDPLDLRLTGGVNALEVGTRQRRQQ